MSRTYSCWMLNCWCITWPVGFKRLTLTHYLSIYLCLSLSFLNGYTVEHSSIIAPRTWSNKNVYSCVSMHEYLCMCAYAFLSYLFAFLTCVCVCFRRNYNSQKYFLYSNIWEKNDNLQESSMHGIDYIYIYIYIYIRICSPSQKREWKRPLKMTVRRTRELLTWTSIM